jgi:hypothetical protein
VRLLEYSTVAAPNGYGFREPEYPSDVRFDDTLRLMGYHLPLAVAYAPGHVLPLSLYWQAERPPQHDYLVAWFVVPEGAEIPAVQGMDSQPGGGFAPTSRWQPGVPVWDNRALRLPADLQPGAYRLWVRVYYWDRAGKLQLVPVQGSDRADEHTAVLPVQIRVNAS